MTMRQCATSRAACSAGQGYSVSEARLGRDALVLAATEKPDLTLLDVKLPDLSGIEVCREIKSRFPHMIVLQTSAAFTGVADRTRALDGGADSFLVEPIEPDELVATVNALLRMRRAEQEARRINRDLEQLVAERTRELARAGRRRRSIFGGLNNWQFHCRLTAGGNNVLRLPTVLFGRFDGDLNGATQRLHDYRRENRPDPNRPIPVQFNSWYRYLGEPNAAAMLALAVGQAPRLRSLCRRCRMVQDGRG
jgi:CheY-like chemotaxis protein